MKTSTPLLCLLISGCVPPSPRTVESFKSDAGSVIRSLEKRYAEAREYPKTLPPELGLECKKIWARWAYHSDGSSFDLAFGDYAKDGFYIRWDSTTREWATDL